MKSYFFVVDNMQTKNMEKYGKLCNGMLVIKMSLDDVIKGGSFPIFGSL